MIANFWEQSVYGDAINESHSLLLQQVDHGCLQVANISHKALKVLFGLDMGRLPFLWCRDWGQRISDLGKGVGQVVEGSPVLHFIASGAKVKVRAVEALVTDATNGSVASIARSVVSSSVCLTNKLQLPRAHIFGWSHPCTQLAWSAIREWWLLSILLDLIL